MGKVYIRSMNGRPDHCAECPICNGDDDCMLLPTWYDSWDAQYADCPLEEVSSADRPSVADLSSVYSTAYKSGYEKGKADRPQGWIPCSERLPSKGIAVLVNGIMYDAPPITISADAPYDYKHGWINAWMPLPEPWKGADDELPSLR